jgi:hypothetical protein
LAPGASQTLTKAVVVAEDSPTDNVGTVNGTDVLGKVVTSTDTAHIDIVLGLVLARTGFDAVTWVALGVGLLAVGFLLVLLPAPVVNEHSRRPSRLRFRR